MPTPRKHHYVPKSYLAAWTDSGTADGQLQVIDKQSGRDWAVRPANAAAETDLYLIDLSEAEGDVTATEIETGFATIESAAMPVIKRVLAGQDTLDGVDQQDVMAFVSILTMRVPARLRWIDEFMKKPVEAVYRRLEAEGKLPQPDDPELAAKMKEWFANDLIQVKIKQNAKLAMMVSTLPTLMQLLSLRHWSVLRAAPSAGDLVCTDHPVLLEWIKAVPTGTSPGFGLENTAVFVPIGPQAALLGLWSSEPRDRTLSESQVAFWNGELLGYVDRFVFSRGDFAALHKSGAIDRRPDVIRRWQPSSGSACARA